MFRQLLLSGLWLGVLVLSGCASPEVVKVSYDEPVKFKSDKSGVIQLSTGLAVKGEGGPSSVFVGQNVHVLVSTGPYPDLHFGAQDQRKFAETLKDELNRLSLLRVSRVSDQGVEGADVSIEVIFLRTDHRLRMQEYFLDVAMRVKAGSQSFENRYEVLSSEGDNVWQMMNTSAEVGKQKAAKKLLAKLIPDIEKFVSTLK